MACGRGLRRANRDYAAFYKTAYAVRSNSAAGLLARLAWAAILALCFAVPAQAADDAFERGLLWRIEKAGVAPSYVFGTIHLADPRVTALPEPVRQRFDAAQAFAMEVPLDQPDLMALAARMIFSDGRDLPGVVGDALFRQVLPELEKIGVPAELARMFKPWAVMLILEIPPQQSSDVLDLSLQRAAAAQGKSLHYLESVDEQVGALDGMSDADQVALLRHAVESQRDRAQSTRRLLEAWLQRDLAQMWRIGEEDVAARPELKPLQDVFVRRLLTDRNLKMVERMQPLLASGNAFVAVGALHLFGGQGVLSLLQGAGYRVSRVY
jgi:uncharacterized protein YbaP (TraB family)